MKERIIQLLRDTCALPEEIGEDTLLQTLSLDSLSFIECLVNVENEFGIEFEPDDLMLANWETVGKFIKSAEGKYAEIQIGRGTRF